MSSDYVVSFRYLVGSAQSSYRHVRTRSRRTNQQRRNSLTVRHLAHAHLAHTHPSCTHVFHHAYFTYRFNCMAVVMSMAGPATRVVETQMMLMAIMMQMLALIPVLTLLLHIAARAVAARHIHPSAPTVAATIATTTAAITAIIVTDIKPDMMKGAGQSKSIKSQWTPTRCT